MATPIKRIERDYYLKVLYDEQLPLVYHRNRTQYIFTLEKPVRDELSLRADRPVPGLKLKGKLHLMFDYRGQTVSFSSEINFIRDDHIKTPVPESLYKNLDRSFSRVSFPQDLRVQFTFLEDRYSLSYPRIAEGGSEKMNDIINKADIKNFSGLVEQMAGWRKSCASGHKLVIFKDVKPSSTEEQIIAETGKALYLPNTSGGFPEKDPFPRKRIVTADLFKRCLETAGVALNRVDEAAAQFIKAKKDGGISSDAWAPILFQEYVIGYIHIWANTRDGKPPFDYGILETLLQFAKILAFSLKANGFFEQGLIKNDPFGGQVIDISASGLLFACPGGGGGGGNPNRSSVHRPETELGVQLATPGRTVKAAAKIVRCYKDAAMGYFGCCFSGVEPGDLRYLFEFIYGKPFTEEDAQFLAGQV
jgi:hypothetical protein